MARRSFRQGKVQPSSGLDKEKQRFRFEIRLEFKDMKKDKGTWILSSVP
jgi:hypothetical protein